MPRPPIRVVHPHVRSDADKFAGSPYIEGTGVLVRRLWAWHRGGTTLETLLRRYPQVGPAKILDALSFAWDNTEFVEDDLAREQRLLQREKAPRVGLRPMAQQQLPLSFNENEEEPGS